MDYPGWTIETTHPVEEGTPGYCRACAEAVAPTVATAVRTESPAHGHRFEEPPGTAHTIVVRATG